MSGHFRRFAPWLLLVSLSAASAHTQTSSAIQPPQPPQATQTGHAADSSSPPAAQTLPGTHAASSPPTPATPPPVPVQTEIGKIDGASFRIDIPKNWNHGLVLYFHGYQPIPQTFDPKYPPTRILQEILNRGYAVARSGYAVGGWAVPQAAAETEALRRYFRKRYGAPHEILLWATPWVACSPSWPSKKPRKITPEVSPSAASSRRPTNWRCR